MGLIKLGRVIKSYIAKVSGSGKLAQWLALEEFAGDERKAQVFGPCNEDFAPPEGTSTIDVPLGRDRAFLTSVAYRNKKIIPTAVAGERRIYATNEGGDTVMCEVFLQQDGTILVKNALAQIQIMSNGAVSIFRSVNEFISMNSAGEITIQGTNGIKLNGASDNLTMWSDLNAQLQAFIVAYNAHLHFVPGSGNSTAPTVSASLDITGARADTLKTNG
jgi:hypothetical protein